MSCLGFSAQFMKIIVAAYKQKRAWEDKFENTVVLSKMRNYNPF